MLLSLEYQTISFWNGRLDVVGCSTLRSSLMLLTLSLIMPVSGKVVPHLSFTLRLSFTSFFFFPLASAVIFVVVFRFLWRVSPQRLALRLQSKIVNLASVFVSFSMLRRGASGTQI